jgi:hypothetical protein
VSVETARTCPADAPAGRLLSTIPACWMSRFPQALRGSGAVTPRN